MAAGLPVLGQPLLRFMNIRGLDPLLLLCSHTVGMGEVEMNNVSITCTGRGSVPDSWRAVPRQRVSDAPQLLAALAAGAAAGGPGIGAIEVVSDVVLDGAGIRRTALPFTVSSGRTLVLVGGERLRLVCHCACWRVLNMRLAARFGEALTLLLCTQPLQAALRQASHWLKPECRLQVGTWAAASTWLPWSVSCCWSRARRSCSPT